MDILTSASLAIGIVFAVWVLPTLRGSDLVARLRAVAAFTGSGMLTVVAGASLDGERILFQYRNGDPEELLLVILCVAMFAVGFRRSCLSLAQAERVAGASMQLRPIDPPAVLAEALFGNFWK